MDKKYREYLQSDEWAQLKIDLFKDRGYKCEECGNKKRLAIHHLTYENIYNENSEDLIILCEKCHKKAHGINKRIPNNFKILTLAEKIQLKKTNKKAYKKYVKSIKQLY
jgi:5-methylcytosine-specific restriction endonuclease McrA